MLISKFRKKTYTHVFCAQETEMKMRVQTLLEEFEQEKADLSLDGQANVKVLTEKLEKEREAMTAFKVRGTGDFVGVFAAPVKPLEVCKVKSGILVNRPQKRDVTHPPQHGRWLRLRQ